MSDLISGIQKIGPAYPVKPVRIPHKHREPGKRHQKDGDKPKPDERHDDDKTIIDELV